MTSGPPDRFYRTPADLSDLEPRHRHRRPGSFPFTRGVQPSMYRGRPWTMRQYAGFADAAESNRRYRYLLSQGVSGLSVAFDLPTQIGYDSDHPLAAGEVGRVGVAIDSIEDMAALFDGIPLDRVSTSMTINATAIILLALYIARREAPGRGAERPLRGRCRTTSSRSTSRAAPTSIRPVRRCASSPTSSRSASARCRSGTRISISGYHIREAGSTAVQEVAFTLAHATAYVQSAIDAGLDVNYVRSANLVLLQRAQRLPRGDREVPRRPAPVGAPDGRRASARPIRARSSCAFTRRRRAAR